LLYKTYQRIMWTKCKKDDKYLVQRAWLDGYTSRGPPVCFTQPAF